MSRSTIAAVLIAYFAILIVFASIMQTAFPPMTSPLAARLFPLTPYEQSTLTVHITGLIATAGTAFLLSGVIPLVAWAISRFDAKRAKGPLVTWAILAMAFCYLVYFGANAEFRKSPEAITTNSGRADLIAGIMNSCAENRRKNPHEAAALMNSESYCRCFGDKLAPLLTADDIRGFDGHTEPGPSLREKIKWARDECVSAAIKSHAKLPSDDDWEDVPPPQPH